jgi:uncharacterized membrane protein
MGPCFHSSLVCTLAIGLLITASSSSHATSFSFTPLGDGTFVAAVSGDGSTVVGQRSGPEGSGPEAFLWNATGGMQGLGFAGLAWGVSADGSSVVGGSEGGAFLWNATSGMQSLGLLPGDTRSEARGVSADGSIVVGFSWDPPNAGTDKAFIWDAVNGMQELVPGRAFAITPDGSTVVGGTIGGSEGPLAFVWDAINGMQTLSREGVDVGPIAFAVSADGSTVVGGDPAFIWNPVSGDVQIPLDPLVGAEARGVSADGSTVVGRTFGGRDDAYAWIWDAANGTQSLQELLTSAGVDLTGWTLEQARGISADGRTIVGNGTREIGDTSSSEGWIVRIAAVPEPSTALLVALGLGALLFRERRGTAPLGSRSAPTEAVSR